MSQTEHALSITVIGLGQMGGNMALTLQAAGFEVTGSDLFEAARERLAGLGLAVVAPDALPASDVYLLSLPTSAHVREVIETSPGLLALAPKGSVIVDTSTSDPAVSRELAEKVTAAGLHWLDAPVSGGPKGAANGTLGMLLGGVGLLASTGTAMSDPSLKNWLKAAGDGLGLTQKGLELAVGMGKINEGSLLGKAGASLVGRVLGAGMAVFDVWSAVESAQQGDYTSAGLYGAGAVGGVTAALFTGPIGWAGLAVVGISAAGLWVWNGVKESRKHEPDSDGGTAMRFLQHAGLNESAARALTDQSGDGHSVMPLLNRYAELKGMKLDDPVQQKKFIDWINGMQPEHLAALRDNLHETADDIDGDPAKFNATADGDRYVVPDIAARPWFTRMGDHGPESVAQLEAQLQVLQIPVLG